MPSDPSKLAELPFLSFREEPERQTWALEGPAGDVRTVTFDPVLWSSEFDVLIGAARAGRGIALLPAESVQAPIAEGRLARALPEWHSEDVTVHLVFPTARGMPPAVRAFIDFVADNYVSTLAGNTGWRRISIG